MVRTVNECTENYIDVNDTELCYFEWGQANENKESVLLIHATGFHARCWDQTIRHLGDRHVIAVEMRGHGRSKNKGPFSWETFGDDLSAFIEAMKLKNFIAAGHSMGGHALVHALAKISGGINRAVLIDPVIMNPQVYAEASSHAQFLNEAGEHPVARRRNQFLDAEAMFQNFHGRGSYASWLDASLHDYCQHGILPDPEGVGFNLACPPVVEASIYMGSSTADILVSVQQILIPVLVLRAEQRLAERTELDFTKSPTWTDLAAHFQQGRDVYLPQLTHFMPMQDPELVASYILGER